jgi:crotonobetainyl-CoA:carnitine CoA-transferase CaiB-like acyl-CoA transferase
MDYATAVSLTQGIMAALIEREHSGRNCSPPRHN